MLNRNDFSGKIRNQVLADGDLVKGSQKVISSDPEKAFYAKDGKMRAIPSQP